jgi:transcriptional regulator with XRE-family HTH domain
MPSDSVQNRISLLIKAKKRKDGLGVREAAKAAKISPATFSRMERGLAATLPDVATLEKLAAWLGVTVDSVLGEKKGRTKTVSSDFSTPDLVAVHLRADKNLTPDTAKALADMFNTLYEHATKKHAT